MNCKKFALIHVIILAFSFMLNVYPSESQPLRQGQQLEIKLIAAQFIPKGWEYANDMLLPINSNHISEVIFLGNKVDLSNINDVITWDDFLAELTKTFRIKQSSSELQDCAQPDIPKALRYIVTTNKVLKQSTPFVSEIKLVMVDEKYQLPEGWMFADGRSLKTNEYPKLYAMIGTIYGNGIANQFKLPNLTEANNDTSGQYRYIIAVDGSYPSH